MRSDLNRTGHSVGDANGVIIAADACVCDLLQRSARELIGMSYLTITHPDDRAANAKLIAALPCNVAPITFHKRYLSADGSAVSVEVVTSRFGEAEGFGRLVGTLSWHDGPTVTPAGLWQTAYRIETLSRLRGQLLGSELFPDYPMNLLLRLYAAEMEGRVITGEDAARELGMAPPLAARWLAVLTARGLIDPAVNAATPRQLSDDGVARLEHLLRAAGQPATGPAAATLRTIAS